MKTIGLIGGMSWESTREYYRIINETVREKLGGLHSAKCTIYSFDFQDIASLQERDDWETLARLLIDAALRLEKTGAGVILICTNTMHKVADDVRDALTVPLLHIADAAAERIIHEGKHTIGLMGTRFTMEEDFYKKRLYECHGVDVLVPSKAQREKVDSIIFEELCAGVFREHSKEALIAIMNELIAAGSEGILLGCTELPLIVHQEDVPYPVFDTTAIHARAAVEYALS